MSQPETNLEWISMPRQKLGSCSYNRSCRRKSFSEVCVNWWVRLFQPIPDNPAYSPSHVMHVTAQKPWLSMIALVNHTLSAALRYHRVYRRISSSASVVPNWYVRYLQPAKTKPFTYRLCNSRTHGITIRDRISQFTRRCPGTSSRGIYPTPRSCEPASSTFSESADARRHPPPCHGGGNPP